MKITVLLLLALAATPFARAEEEVHVSPTSNPTFSEMPPSLPLWPGVVPASGGHSGAPKSHWENYATTWYAVVTDVNIPVIFPFLPPADKATGAAVIVCPGGGHRFLAMEHEGYAVGKWLSEHGIAAFVLEYRLAKTPGADYSVEVHSLMDAQRAIRTVRSRAKEWNVNPAAVGIMGFSAGGEVAVLAASRFDTPVKGSGDAIDAISCRPDFQALFYPGLPKPHPASGAATPPAFLCAASDDSLGLTPGLVHLYEEMTAAHVPAELHLYAHGGHGFGIRDQDKAVYSWMPLFAIWLRGEGFIAGTGTQPAKL